MKFKNFIADELNITPPFINQRDSIHYEIWLIMLEINSIILEMVSLNILSKNRIYSLVKRFHNFVEFCMSNLDKVASIEFSEYYVSTLEWIKEESIREEQFETTCNFKLFDDIYVKKIEMSNE